MLGSFIFGLPSDRQDTFEATVALAERADVTFAQFVMLTPFPGTVDFEKWETRSGGRQAVDHRRHPDYAPLADSAGQAAEGVLAASGDVARRDPRGTQAAWDRFYSCRASGSARRCVHSLEGRLAFVLISKLYRQMYANTGIATDCARVSALGHRGPLAGASLPEAVRRHPDAGAAGALGGTVMPRLTYSIAGIVFVATVAHVGVGRRPRLARSPTRQWYRRSQPGRQGLPGEGLRTTDVRRYSMSGYVRPLLFWFGRDDIGLARVVWRTGDDGARGYELLVGTDPAKAPRALNRWGFVSEEVHGAEGAVLALMTGADEGSYDEAAASADRRSGGSDFRAIHSRVLHGTTAWQTVRVQTPGSFSVHDVEHALDRVREETSAARSRQAALPDGARPGFLVALAELIDRGPEPCLTARRDAGPTRCACDTCSDKALTSCACATRIGRPSF